MGNATHGQSDKRTMARKHNAVRGQLSKLKRDVGVPRLHGEMALEVRREICVRVERNVREVP